MTLVVSTSVVTANIPPGAEEAFTFLDGWDVILSQENQKRDLRKILPKHLNVHFAGGVTGRCAVSFRDPKRWDVRKTDHPLLNAANGLTFPGARREAAVASVRDLLTGRIWTFESAHLVPHADDEQGGITDMPRGRLAVTPAITSMVKYFPKVMVGQEVIGGDFNIDWDRDWKHHDRTDLLERMRAAGFISDGALFGNGPDTHEPNEYDWIFSRLTSKNVWPSKRLVLPKHGSDHHPKGLIYRSTARAGWPKR